MIRALVKNWLLSKDTILSRPPGQFNIWEIKLRKARDRGLRISSALDGGAANGGWTRQFKAIYPDASVLCVDPREDVQVDLQETANELGGVVIAKTLLGETIGEVEFHDASDQSSMLASSGDKNFGTVRKSPMTTIDALVAELRFPFPDLIKLDLQGAELIALSGANQSLQHAQALLLEVSFFRLQVGGPLAHEVISFLRERGFRLYDIAGLWTRPLDGALAQGDFLFLRDRHPLLADERWSSNG